MAKLFEEFKAGKKSLIRFLIKFPELCGDAVLLFILR